MKICRFFFCIKKNLLPLFFIIISFVFNVYGEDPCSKSFSKKTGKLVYEDQLRANENQQRVNKDTVELSKDSVSYLIKILKSSLEKSNDILLTSAREKELIIKYRNTRDQAAFKELLLSLIYLIKRDVSIVSYRWGRPDFIDDIFQEAILKFIRGLDSYDLNSDYRLSTYVFKYMLPSLHGYIRSKMIPVRIPKRVRKLPYFVSMDQPLYDKEGSNHEVGLKDYLVDEKVIPMGDQITHSEKIHVFRTAINSIRPELTELENAILNAWIADFGKTEWEALSEKFVIGSKKLRTTQENLMRKLRVKLTKRGIRKIL